MEALALSPQVAPRCTVSRRACAPARPPRALQQRRCRGRAVGPCVRAVLSPQSTTSSKIHSTAPPPDAAAAAAVAAAALHAVEESAANSLRGVVPPERADAALADLKRRLEGWPATLAAAAPSSEAAPHAPHPAHAAAAAHSVSVSRSDANGVVSGLLGAESGAGSAPPAWALVACAAVDRSTCVRQLWQLSCGAWLLLEARCVPSTRGVGGASYVVTALTDATAPSLRLHYCLSTAGASCAAAAHDAGAWAFHTPGHAAEPLVAAAADADPTATPLPRAPGLRRAVARLRPAVGAAALCFLLQSPEGLVHNAGREFILPLPSGLLAQIAADAAAAGDCAARITLTLGRAGETGCAGSLLGVVRETAEGGVVIELFSDAPHPLTLHWGLLEPGAAVAGRSAWRAPPPGAQPPGSSRTPNGGVLTPFALFAASVAPPPGAGGLSGAATLQRACLAFSATAADRYSGIAFVVRSSDGKLAWRNNWAHFEIPWARDACAAAWDEPRGE